MIFNINSTRGHTGSLLVYIYVGDSGTDEKTGGRDGGGRVEDVAIFIRSDKNGQDQE